MRLISVDDYCENICRCIKEKCDREKCPIHNAPTIEAVPVVKAHWHSIYTNNMGVKVGFCSNCGHQKEVVNNYCGNCGAKIEGGAE